MKQVQGGAFRGRVYVGTTSEFVGFDRSNTWEALTTLSRFAIDLVPALAHAHLVRSWAGFRPRTPDGRFLVGEAAPGLFVATGHDSNGVQQAVWTGKLVAEWIHQGARPDALAPFDVARLAGPPAPAS
jgi:glycine/D-amino acid oxidase-like deaminating enzyme